MTVELHDAPVRPRTAVSCGAVLLGDRERAQQVRRRVLEIQLARLTVRACGADGAARDASARALGVAKRLETDDLEW